MRRKMLEPILVPPAIDPKAARPLESYNEDFVKKKKKKKKTKKNKGKMRLRLQFGLMS